MKELINGRTPEEIKSGLYAHSQETLDCKECPYDGESRMDCSELMCLNALAYIQHIESERDAALAKVPKWISVEERLPDTTNVYLIHMVHRYNKNDGYRCMDVRLFFKGEFEPWQGLPDIYEVTHWMPLPEPPEEER